MPKRAVTVMLLFAIFVNIAHAAFIYSLQSCDHETVCEYVMEIEQGSYCGDLCDIHHMFHLSAIPAECGMSIPTLSGATLIDYTNRHYRYPPADPDYRPPIQL